MPKRTRITFDGKTVMDPASLMEQMEAIGVDPPPELSLCNSFTMTRGRDPSVGYLLFTREVVESFGDLSLDGKGFTLQFSETDEKTNATTGVATIEKLYVVETRAIYPEVVQAKASDPVTASATTPYLVTIADARYRANLNKSFESTYRLDPGSTGEDIDEAREFTPEIVAASHLLLSRLLTKVTLRPTEQEIENRAPTIANWVTPGFGTYSATMSVIESAGMTLYPAADGSFVIDWYKPGSKIESLLSESLKARRLLDSKLGVEKAVVPKTIAVQQPHYDFQWYRLNRLELETAQESYRTQPLRPTEISLGLAYPAGIPEGIDPVGSIDAFSNVPYITKDGGPLEDNYNQENHQRADADAIRVARRMWDTIIAVANDDWVEIEGVVANFKIEEIGDVGTVVWSDLGEGLTTSVFASEVAPDIDNGVWIPSRQEFSTPHRIDLQPYGKEAYVKVGSPIGGGISSPGNDEEEGSIKANAFCHCALMSGHKTAANTVNWIERKQIVAVNATGRAIKPGRFAYAKWNYQVGEGGEWCIVSVGGSKTDDTPVTDTDLADWAAQCVLEGTPVPAIQDPGLVIVNRRTMLRLLSVGADPDGPAGATGDMAIDIEHGPANSVLWTAEKPENVIFWTDSPTMTNLTLKEGFLKFDKNDKETWLGPPRNASAKIRLPPNAPRSHQYLISDSGGTSTSLGWAGPGLNCIINVVNPITDLLDHLCDYMGNCQTHGGPLPPGDEWVVQQYRFQNGLLTTSSDIGCDPPRNKGEYGGMTEVDGVFYNPCEDDDGGDGGSPGEGTGPFVPVEPEEAGPLTEEDVPDDDSGWAIKPPKDPTFWSPNEQDDN